MALNNVKEKIWTEWAPAMYKWSQIQRVARRSVSVITRSFAACQHRSGFTLSV